MLKLFKDQPEAMAPSTEATCSMATFDRLRRFAGATAVITGGASGIGRALGEALARKGCEVVLADRQVDLASEVAGKIVENGGSARALELDVRNFLTMEHVVRDTRGRTGRLDYLFNNAGIATFGTADQYGIDDWNEMLDVHLRGTVNGVQAAYPIMIAQGYGHIVNTSSLGGLVPEPGAVAYGTAKHAIVGLLTSLRVEAAQFGVRVSVLCPGAVRTPMLYGRGEFTRMLSEIPLDRLHAAWERARPVSPDVFARKALGQIRRNRAIVVVPGWWRLFWWINRLSPTLGLFVARKSFTKWQEAIRPDRR